MTVNFTARVQNSSARFSIPKSTIDQLGLGAGGSIHIVIRSPAGKEVFRGVEILKSGNEVYGDAIANAVKPGDQILVQASSPPPSTGVGRDWSETEVAATVADYFAMLKAELEGEAYSKAAHRRALLKRLSNRSPQAAEFKHCNISAVLRDMKLTYISGYKPRGNYQELLADAVKNHLGAFPGLRKEVVEVDSNPVDVPPDGSQFVLKDIEVPAPEPTERGERRSAKPVKTNWDSVGTYSRKLGEQGEEFVLNLERRRAREAGRTDLEAEIEWVSDTQGDGAGYDIRSFDDSGSEIFIEVKTTKGPEGTAFYVTANELRCSEERGPAYRLYRVFLFGTSPKLYRLSGPLAAVLNLEPRVYSAVCKGVNA